MTIPPVRALAYFFSSLVHAGVVGAVLITPDYQSPQIAETAGIVVEVVAELPGGLLENSAEDLLDSTQSEAGAVARETPREPEIKTASEVSGPPKPQEHRDLDPMSAKLLPPTPEVEITEDTPNPSVLASLAPAAGGVASEAAAKAAETGPSHAPRLLSNPKPLYPKRARKQGITGQVLLRVLVGAEGRSKTVQTLQTSGHAMLDAAAVAAIQKWRFAPARRNGVPVAVTLDVPVTFQIKN